MKNLLLLFASFITLNLPAQQLYYLSDIPANPNFGVALQDTHLYVIKAFSVSSFNISQPATPVYLSTASPTYWPFSLYTDGNYLYCGGGMSGQLTVIDLSQPNLLNMVFQDPSVTGTVYQFTKSAQHLYFTTNQDSLIVADISNPALPVIASRIFLNSGFSEGAAAVGNRLFLGTNGGLRAYDISNPSTPALITTYPGSFRTIYYNALQQQLYALTNVGTVSVYNAGNINALTLAYTFPANATKLSIVNNRIAALQGGSVELFEAGSTAATSLATYTTPPPNGQHVDIAMQDSIIAYTTGSSTYILKYGVVNPVSLNENSSNFIQIIYHQQSNEITFLYPTDTQKMISRIEFYTANGQLTDVYENVIENKIKLTKQPVLYKLYTSDGLIHQGKLRIN